MRKSVIVVGLVLILILGALAAASMITASKISDDQKSACRADNILSGYLQKRARTLKGSTRNDMIVVQRGRPIVECPSQKPLSDDEQNDYINLLFKCACEPVIENRKVTNKTVPFKK